MQTNLAYSHSDLINNEDWAYLQQIVDINSQSKNIEGVNQVQYLFKKKLDSLGMKSLMSSNRIAMSGDLLIARSAGKSSYTLSTIGHADTVLGPTPDHYFKFSSDGSKVFGPGIADNKSGILIALKGIEYFLTHCDDQYLNLQFVSSPNEEIGSPGFHKIFNQLGQESQFVLGFEPSLECGSIIHSRNGNCWYRLDVHGETYHSGRAHKGHMNAAHDLCKKIDYFHNQLKDTPDVTMNVGMIEGGHSYNTICEKLSAKIDTRFSTFKGLKKIQDVFESCHQHLKYACAKTNKKSKSSISIDDFCPPLEANERSKDYLKQYLHLLNNIQDHAHKSVHCGGAADVNHFSHPELVAFDGLGAVGGNMHRRDEYIETKSLEIKAVAFGQFLLSLNQQIKEELI